MAGGCLLPAHCGPNELTGSVVLQRGNFGLIAAFDKKNAPRYRQERGS